MSFFAPEQYTPGGQSLSPDPITYEADDAGPPLNYRWETPPPGEDGTIVSRALTVIDSPDPLPEQAPGMNQYTVRVT
jgi:hypothetical protein